jgi:arylsulfatase A-like enzyme
MTPSQKAMHFLGPGSQTNRFTIGRQALRHLKYEAIAFETTDVYWPQCRKLFYAALILCMTGWLSAIGAQSEPPNIVLMLVDDMGVMDTSVPFLTDTTGQPKRYPLNDYYRTPNMERLAARGIRFTQFYAMSVCSPTRISIMTGQNAARHRTTNWINPDTNNAGPNGPPEWNWEGLKQNSITLARVLQEQGYRTIHVGKGHFGPNGSQGGNPLNLGFDINIGGSSIGQPGSYYAEQNYGVNGQRDNKAVPGIDQYHGTKTFLTEALTIEANAKISEAVSQRKPFFLYFPQYAVHAPFDADPRFADNYKASGKKPQAQAFATLIEGMDKSLGDLLDHLEKIGVADNTLVVFLGDNGSDAPLGPPHEVACAAPLRGKKGAHYEGGMRVPFIAAWANPHVGQTNQKRLPISAGSLQTQLATVCDLFPTVLALVGIDHPVGHPIDGLRLDTLFSGKPDETRQETFLMHFPHAHRSEYFTVYRDGPWKSIYHYFPSESSNGSHYQLFHLADDPFEQNDLASQNPLELANMMRKMIAALASQNAIYPRREGSSTPLIPKLP